MTAGCFLLAAFFAPVAGMIGGGCAIPNAEHYARFAGFTVPGGSHFLHPVTAGALVVVGFLMMQIVRDIPFTDFEEDFPAFLVILGIPLTYSISSGIGLGFIAHVLIKAVRGRARAVHPLLWVIAAAFAANFLLPWLGTLGD